MTIAATFPPTSIRKAAEQYDRAGFRDAITNRLVNYLIDMISTEKVSIASAGAYTLVANPFLIPLNQLKVPNFSDQTLLLGKGGFGTVYRSKLGSEEVAVKVVPFTRANRDKTLARITRELRLMISCPHQNIVRAYGYCEVNSSFLLVMECCGDGTLWKVWPQLQTIEKRVSILKQLAKGLVLMHAKNICHFDIKPGNILFQRGVPKLSDFGLSRIIPLNASAKKAGLTIRFASPEQLEGAPCGRTADIWSFGIITFSLLQGKHPFQVKLPATDSSERRKEIMLSKINEVGSDLPFQVDFRKKYANLSNLMERCLQIEPANRPTAREILETL
jgi:serine/threonine protein kinase